MRTHPSPQERARRAAGSRQLAVRPWLERAEVPQPAAGIAGTNLLTVPEKSRAKNVILHTHPYRLIAYRGLSPPRRKTHPYHPLTRRR